MSFNEPSLTHGYTILKMACETTVGFFFLGAVLQRERFARLLRVHAELLKSEATLIVSFQILQERNRELQELSIRDALTGLHNRRHFDDRLLAQWPRLSRAQQPLSILFLDVDYFKLLNDNYGHEYGDECLRQIASIFDSRPSREEDCLARFGGEEFVLLLPGTDLYGALFIAEQLRKKIFELSMAHSGSPEGFVSISVGVSSRTRSEDDSPSMLVQRADEAMYEAKKTGRNRVCLKEGRVQEALMVNRNR